jgi:hypothetical protein
MYGSPVGDKLVLASTPVELYTAGSPVRLFNIHIISGTAGIVSIYNGGAGGTLYLKETGTANTGKTIDYGINGKLFPNGCYVSPDANATSVLCSYRAEL